MFPLGYPLGFHAPHEEQHADGQQTRHDAQHLVERRPRANEGKQVIHLACFVGSHIGPTEIVQAGMNRVGR